MTNFPDISLNDQWQCAYFDIEPDLHEFPSDDTAIVLADWSFNQQQKVGQAAWLCRYFDLKPTDECVQYFLMIESAPQDMRIYINEKCVATYAEQDTKAAFALNVTAAVWLDANQLVFRVEDGSRGRFTGVRLQAVPCE